MRSLQGYCLRQTGAETTLGDLEKGRKAFFFKKKKQRTFIPRNGCCGDAHLEDQKFFGSFFQKRTFFLAFSVCAAGS
jgi:hypothetical protein